MRPVDTEAIEAAAWQDFVQRLADHLAGQWPALRERLGDRYPAFIDLAVQQAGERGLTLAASVARFVNLYVVWGPTFQDKSGFEWAQAMLASLASASASASPEREWLTVHQLVQRSLAELQRLPGARIEPQALALADARLLDVFGQPGRQGQMRPPDPAFASSRNRGNCCRSTTRPTPRPTASARSTRCWRTPAATRAAHTG